jgi:hypothetical protein
VPDIAPKHTSNISTFVDDLAWVINSPPLITGLREHCDWTTNGFWQRARIGFTKQLLQTQSNPNGLRQLLNTQTDHRLGHYFETLLSYWFTSNERYQVLAHNLQVRDEERTIGEFDFIIQDTVTNTTQHWEVACKFYLGIGNTQHIEQWYGPMLKDKLVNKFQQMQTKQSELSEHPATQTLLEKMGIQIDQKICLMKGRLFYPLQQTNRLSPSIVSSQHLKGWWSKPSTFIQHFKNSALTWRILDKKQWFAPQAHNNQQPYTADNLLDIFLSEYNRPVCIAGFNLNGGPTEVERGFLVPKDWANQLNIIDNTPYSFN